VEVLLANPEIQPYAARISRPLVKKIITSTLAEYRRHLVSLLPDRDIAAEALARCLRALDDAERRRLGKVLNGTGVILHTNLGRAPLSKEAWRHIESVNTGYSNLEFGLDAGERGSRGGLVPELLQALPGAEAGLAVNNNAAAVLLALSTLASGREVIVSRGEAVQIGGGFRIPDILALSGARLVEVGTTNITTAEDYLSAVTPETAMVLVVHTSNFALRGFTEKPSLRKLRKVLPEGLPLVVDQGSGCTVEQIPNEPSLSGLIRDGADLVCFSGDKILGGPQAGLIVGRADLVAKLGKHPMMRAFRPGKTIFSLLEAVLIERLNEGGSTGVERALAGSGTAGLAALKVFGRKILRDLPAGRASLAASRAAIGGGSAPDETLPSVALCLRPLRSATRLARCLRSAPVPLVGRIEGDRVILDLMTLAGEEAPLLASMINSAFAEEPES